MPRKIITTEKEQLGGATHGLLGGNFIAGKGKRRSGQFLSLILPGLGSNLFSVKQAAGNRIVSVFPWTTQGKRQTTSLFHSKNLGVTSTLSRWISRAEGVRRSWQYRLWLTPPYGIGDWNPLTVRIWTS